MKNKLMKKTLVITILSILLLSGLTSVSAVKIKANDGLPDLEISISSTGRGQYTITIKNIGNAPAVVPEPKVMKNTFQVYRPSGKLYDEIDSVWQSGDEIPAGHCWVETFDNLPRTDSICTIKAWVDRNPGALPNGVIMESDESNNYAEISLQGRSLSKSSMKIMLLSFLERHSLLHGLTQRLLGP